MNGRHPGPPTPQVGSDPGYNSLFDSAAAGAPVVDAQPREESAPDPPARRGRTRRVIAILALALILLVGLLGSALYISVQNLSSNITRVPDVFSALDGAERPAPVDNRVSFLVMGTDSRHATGRRGDEVLMLARVDVDLDPTTTGASVVSIPRDSWVDVPEHGRDKISAAYGRGGPTLLVRTVEKLTDVRIDHFAIIDFAGFQEMVNAVGGIDVGNSHLDGRGALDYVGGGSWAPAGYADRLRRQQTALRALLDKAASSGLLADPIQLLRLLDALSRAVSVDETLSNGSLQELGLQMHGLRPPAVQFLACPTAGLGQEGGQSVVYLDDSRSAELWEALRSDTVQEYARRYPGDVLVAPPR